VAKEKQPDKKIELTCHEGFNWEDIKAALSKLEQQLQNHP
jgi:hypothetical protein